MLGETPVAVGDRGEGAVASNGGQTAEPFAVSGRFFPKTQVRPWWEADTLQHHLTHLVESLAGSVETGHVGQVGPQAFLFTVIAGRAWLSAPPIGSAWSRFLTAYLHRTPRFVWWSRCLHPCTESVQPTNLMVWNPSCSVCTFDTVAGKSDHLSWAEANASLAERLWESDDPTERRWSAVVSYYAILHTAHAVAADLWGAHPIDHFEVRNVVLRLDETRVVLAASVQEASLISVGARYIGDHQSASTWFAPSFTSEEEAIDRAVELMRTVVPELRRMAWP